MIRYLTAVEGSRRRKQELATEKADAAALKAAVVRMFGVTSGGQIFFNVYTKHLFITTDSYVNFSFF